MLYITGQHALNIPCSLDTCGDWHQSALRWDTVKLRDSDESIFKEYGIETNAQIPEHDGVFNVANHIRALLDLLEQGNFALAQGVNKDFICNDEYNYEVFTQVLKLKGSPLWEKIDSFMGKEYYAKWLESVRGLDCE